METGRMHPQQSVGHVYKMLPSIGSQLFSDGCLTFRVMSVLMLREESIINFVCLMHFYLQITQ